MRLDETPAVATAGPSRFADALIAQAAEVTRLQWRPPISGTGKALTTVMADPRMPGANAEAVRRLTTSRPRLVTIERAGDALGLERGEFLHAGPPIEWEDASGPLRGALLGALVYEGLADSVQEAEKVAPTVSLTPNHARHAVGPMAGVMSASMPVFVMHDDVFDTTAYITLNEGLGKVLRFGAYSPEVIDRLRWMERILAPVLAATLRQHGPVDVPSILAQALQMGDDGHNRNRAGTSLFIREIVADLVELDRPTAELAAALRFVNGNDHFMLNVAMGMAKAAADSARDIPGSTMVVAMARRHRVRDPDSRHRGRVVHRPSRCARRPVPVGVHREGRESGPRRLDHYGDRRTRWLRDGRRPRDRAVRRRPRVRRHREHPAYVRDHPRRAPALPDTGSRLPRHAHRHRRLARRTDRPAARGQHRDRGSRAGRRAGGSRDRRSTEGGLCPGRHSARGTGPLKRTKHGPSLTRFVRRGPGVTASASREARTFSSIFARDRYRPRSS